MRRHASSPDSSSSLASPSRVPYCCAPFLQHPEPAGALPSLPSTWPTRRGTPSAASTANPWPAARYGLTEPSTGGRPDSPAPENRTTGTETRQARPTHASSRPHLKEKTRVVEGRTVAELSREPGWRHLPAHPQTRRADHRPGTARERAGLSSYRQWSANETSGNGPRPSGWTPDGGSTTAANPRTGGSASSSADRLKQRGPR